MPEDAVTDGGAAFLADWTHLSVKDFEGCYRSVYPRGQARSWEVLVADAGEQVILATCSEAAGGGFIDRLGRAVANWEHDQGRDPSEIAAMLDRTSGFGLMQAMTNQQRGFMDASILMPMLQASNACAIVFEAGEQIGTAFLVRPDLVMTAAHVVMAANGASWAHTLRPDLQFSFKARENRSADERVKVLPAPNALVDHSPPHGTPPNRLVQSLVSPADKRLDYALIRLAQRVEHVSPIDVDPPATVAMGLPCWAFGYPGGNALKMDVDVVTNDQPGGNRWLHTANAAPGMSGGCCINHLGRLAGIHEGAITTTRAGVSSVQNRGIGIAAIRAAQTAAGKDPMAARSAVIGLEFDDPDMVRGLYRAGMYLASAAFAPTWRAMAKAVFLGADPEHADNLPGFHPWFPRPKFEEWVDRKSPQDRLCLVRGERGVGASFCARILRAKLDPAGLDYFELNPTQVSAMSLGEAFGSGGLDTPSASRTAAANFRYNDVNQLIAGLRRGSDTAPRTCCIAIDFGPVGGPDRLIASKWQECIIALLAEEWIRLVLIGLTEDEQNELIPLLEARPETADIFVEPITLDPVSLDEFKLYARKLAAARGHPPSPAELRDRLTAFTGTWRAADKPDPPVQTAFLALAAITFEAGL